MQKSILTLTILGIALAYTIPGTSMPVVTMAMLQGAGYRFRDYIRVVEPFNDARRPCRRAGAEDSVFLD